MSGPSRLVESQEVVHDCWCDDTRDMGYCSCSESIKLLPARGILVLSASVDISIKCRWNVQKIAHILTRF